MYVSFNHLIHFSYIMIDFLINNEILIRNFFNNQSVFNFSYINYSQIAARLVRQALKSDIRAEAAKRDEVNVKFTPWKDGKPASKYL